MIPLVQLGLPTRANAAHSPPADTAEASGFLAELAAQDDNAAPEALDAQGCLVAGLMVTVQQIGAQAGHVNVNSAERTAPPTTESKGPQSDPIASVITATVKQPSAQLVAATEVAPPETASVSPSDAPSMPQQDNPFSASPNVTAKSALATHAPESAPPLAESSIPPELPIAASISPASHSQAQVSLPGKIVPETTLMPLEKAPKPNLSAQYIAAPNAPEQAAAIPENAPPDQTAASHPDSVQQWPMPPLSPSSHQAATHPAPQNSVVTKATALQLTLAPLPPPEAANFAQPLVPNIAEQDHAAPANPPLPISTAESAWQTFLHRDAPLAPDRTPDQPPIQATPEHANAAIAETLPQPTEPVAPLNSLLQPPNRPRATEQRPVPFQDPASPPLRDQAIAIPNAVVANTPLAPQQPAPDILAQAEQTAHASPNQIAAPTAIAHQSAQNAPPHTPPPISTQLLHHSTAAKTGVVDVLLQPEELGHVKFQIQQHGDSLRILLSAERPETVELLRRHADQLLQEFRQSGFAQASLSFGQWGEQQRPSAPPLAHFDQTEIEPDEPLPAHRPQHSTPNLAPAGGLNLRL
ncbi:flagellar hook-length control protein FliK [Cypionkella sinensis]|uniref:Flagellar hook-length control protein FliK n=1 Tax=Cypionkella sinensis TaxID=1756043 RepID=A0ABV7J2M6_9RHOB